MSVVAHHTNNKQKWTFDGLILVCHVFSVRICAYLWSLSLSCTLCSKKKLCHFNSCNILVFVDQLLQTEIISAHIWRRSLQPQPELYCQTIWQILCGKCQHILYKLRSIWASKSQIYCLYEWVHIVWSK